MKKESPIGLFFSMFLRAVVVILGLIIVVFGIVIVTKVAKGDVRKKKEPSTTVSKDVLTEAAGRDELLSNSTMATTTATSEETSIYDIKILVLNSTDASGLAGRWCEKIKSHGYSTADASDYSVTQSNTRIVATKDGLGKELVALFNNATYEVGTVTENTSESTDGYDVVIIIGSADIDDEGQSNSDDSSSGSSDDSYSSGDNSYSSDDNSDSSDNSYDNEESGNYEENSDSSDDNE